MIGLAFRRPLSSRTDWRRSPLQCRAEPARRATSASGDRALTATIQYSAKRLIGCALARQTALAMLLLIYGAPAIADAEVRIEGNAAAVRVSTSQDTIADVLSALGAAFKLRYRTAVPLSATAGMTYSGSLRQVIARLLDSYNYIVKVNQETTEVIVLGSRG
jgi:hypothetical protein